jgi:hypothetical protein
MAEEEKKGTPEEISDKTKAEEPKQKPAEEVKEKPAEPKTPAVPKAEERPPDKKKKINKMSLKDIEQALGHVKEKMGNLKSCYAKQLLKQKKILTEGSAEK